MAAIFNDIVITYEGKTHTIKPTFAMINRIEQPLFSGGLGISLAGLTARASRGDVPITEITRILALMMNDCGVAATDEDMYVSLMQSDNLMQIVNMVTMAFFPIVREPEKSSAAAGKKK